MSNLPGLVAVRLVVSGRVQGVGFRAGAAAAAIESGVDGWVRNRTDGRVEIHAQGSSVAVEAFSRWAENGPRWARVTDVEVHQAEVCEMPGGFEIRW